LSLISLWTLIQQILGVSREQETWLKENEEKAITLGSRLESSLHQQLPILVSDTEVINYINGNRFNS
jgi:hypothetical protein